MNTLKSLWSMIPRKVLYVVGSFACYAVCRKIGMDADECTRILWGGGALVGTHVATDIAATLRGRSS